MYILREESGRWKASLSGPSFQITESFAGESEAERRVLGWFRRAFPSHVCESRCATNAKLVGAASSEKYTCKRARGTYYTSARRRAGCPRRR